ncbi:hypothetical protein GLAREA_09292 [Glarea lozoyensis ATCC 20868]|uniref:Uncharacterized protein n=1 Tax=Glarea lozoyensis (strain ATCC 20868 / MF5171) TaxID=1116229 RepID=S3DJ02_GLAL2|nr:uncharacterized protein GLAREA_09292 [Glarea lozoyensis ATCC 20868]EPE37129.1 hypothetical protein GLAREA_09292 [Glarea lozoyensis ATCC 20868]
MDPKRGSGRRNSGRRPSQPSPSEHQISPSDTIGSQEASEQFKHSRTTARRSSASSSESQGKQSAARPSARRPRSRRNTRERIDNSARLNSLSYELNAGRSSSIIRRDESTIRAAEYCEEEAQIAYMGMMSGPTYSSRSDKTFPEYTGKKIDYASSIDAPRCYSTRHPPQPLQSSKHMAEVVAAGKRSRQKHLTILGYHGFS